MCVGAGAVAWGAATVATGRVVRDRVVADVTAVVRGGFRDFLRGVIFRPLAKS